MASLRNRLRASHVGAITTGILLGWAVLTVLWSLRRAVVPAMLGLEWIIIAVGSREMPSSQTMTGADLALMNLASDVCTAGIYACAAWLLSRWIYGIGPISVLGTYRERLTRRTDV